MNVFSSDLYFQEKLSSHALPVKESLLIVDRALLPKLPPDFLTAFLFVYPVDAGESLKSLERFPAHINEILETWKTTVSREHIIIALGGGSVGDFAGFVASVLKRGVKLIHIPSTWLAAIDSAHGGKTALNALNYKNQIGTFYPAEKVFIFKDLLFLQPPARAADGLGEMFKMALIEPPSFLEKLVEDVDASAQEILWKNLEQSVAAKYKIVLQDPYETKGLRKVLNLGHTLGHVLEVTLGYSHGEAVTQGLFFTIEWSRTHFGLSSANYQKILKALGQLKMTCRLDSKGFLPLAQGTVRECLTKDKKITADSQIDFVFVRAPGEVVIKKVSVDEIVSEAVRQGWCH